MDNKAVLLKDEAGKLLRVVGPGKEDLRVLGGSYKIVVRSSELLVLQHAADDEDFRDLGHVLMAGEIVAHTTVLDIVNVVSSSRWAGNLHVYGPDSHRVLTFDKGALQSASSNHPDDRLNKVLVRRGVMTAASVETAMRSLTPPDRLGKVLVEQGYITRQQLFDYLNKQTEEIFFSAVLETEGSYVFIVDDDLAVEPTTLANIPVQELLLRGAERLDSLKQFERLVPDMDLCPDLQSGVEVTRLDAKTRLVLAMSNGERSLREIATETWLGKFETMRIARDLVKKGFVQLQPKTPTAQQEVQRLLSSFNELLRYIFTVVEQHGSVGQAQEEINRWLERRPAGGLFPKGVAEDGSIQLDPNSNPARQGDQVQGATAVREALYELASFALFAASLSLPVEEERRLAQDVYRRLHELES